MDKFKVVLDIANKQSNLGFGLVALLTAGGEQIFSSVVFKCPCNDMNFIYGLVFLLVPALALLLLGYILSKKMWKLLTGLCQRRREPRRIATTVVVLLQISAGAVVAPSSWMAVALLNGNYYVCAMTGTNVSAYNKHVCGDVSVRAKCEAELYRLPCGKVNEVPADARDDVMLTLRAHSQILGWLLISSIMVFNLLLTCVARCRSPISYLQLKFWRVYAEEEANLMNQYTTKHAKELAERNLKSFFSQKEPEDIVTPPNEAWESVSSLYRFSTRDHYYSTLHRYVENCQHTETDLVRMSSVDSRGPSGQPAILNFVDGGTMPV
ncbi:calcium homeostasis modulator protein 6-like [Mugil cephalus]|uniref:calcium homeostasis modulator protein 6-like n=1 Tax=Mugil cephalus TaxID=48193 RepID=UPI001FB6C95D|nr:calcium homeostasis modulator protein 6-like [Mugil cephalus]